MGSLELDTTEQLHFQFSLSFVLFCFVLFCFISFFYSSNFILFLNALEKETATHSSVLAWRIPGTGKPGGLPSMGLHRVGHD